MLNDWFPSVIAITAATVFATWIAVINIPQPRRDKGGKYTSFGKYYENSPNEKRLKEWAELGSRERTLQFILALFAAWFVTGFGVAYLIWG